MAKYKLIYFDAKGMGEAIRWLFAASNTEYEDCRLETKAWVAEKPSECILCNSFKVSCFTFSCSPFAILPLDKGNAYNVRAKRFA